MAHQAIDIANALLCLADPNVGDVISHLKLQKQLYYTQGFSIAFYDKPIFDDEIVAWRYGPVVRNVYNHFKEYGAGAIPLPNSYEGTKLSKEDSLLIAEIYRDYGQFSAFKLMEMTHEEPTWKNAIKTKSKIITQSAMKEYFLTLCEDE